VGAVGKPQFIRGSWIKDGAVVVDAGYHAGGIGDIELSAAIDKCSAYTPVPGGVGPVTIATSIEQTVDAANIMLEKEAGDREQRLAPWPPASTYYNVL
jgi:methylenetetrahydrofolate dehydrogenase (NADP+) / methenyltetrahydrofolate cyclohydrolase